jgi:acyl-CoA thioesterase-1
MSAQSLCLVLFLSLASVLAGIRVTCIGDSITEGGGCVAERYTDVLQKKLDAYGKHTYQVFNAGKSSQTMLRMGKCNTKKDQPPSQYGNCSYWNTEAWQDAQNSKPDIVTIMLGTNDAKAFNWQGVQQDVGDFYALDAVRMINIMRALRPSPQIFLMVPPLLYPPFPFQMNATVINDIYPVLIRDIAEVTGCGVIDVHTAYANSPLPAANLTCDGCHPTDAGNELIAQAMYTAITRDE